MTPSMPGRGYAILGQAARSRKTDLVQFLLDSGADVNSRDPGQGLTPLLSAVSNGSFENARLLLSQGADPTRGIAAVGPRFGMRLSWKTLA